MTISIDLSGRRLLIVGASSGIGRATAIAAAAGGADVAVVGRREKQLNEVIEVAGRGIAVAADLRDGAECARAVTDAVSGLGGLDAALFPIGCSPLRLLAKTDGPTWADTFATNVAAPALVTGAVLPHLPAGAPLVYLSSASVAQPVHGLGAYGASKAALDYSIRTWRLEHPDYRFMRLTVGATTPTDLYHHYEADVLAECLPKWTASGLVTIDFMKVEEVGAAIAEVLAFALAHPGITVEDLTLTPSGAAMDASGIGEIVDGCQKGERP